MAGVSQQLRRPRIGEDPMRTKLVAVAAAFLATLSLTTAQAAEPKHGGILHFYHRETPPSLSIHEEATFSVNVPAMGMFNNLVIYDQHMPQNSMDTIVPELATSWAWSKDNLPLTLQAAPRRQVARRRAVHRQGREMHLRPAARQGAGQVPQESAQGLVRTKSPTSPSTATTK